MILGILLWVSLAQAQLEDSIKDKIIQQGVPQASLEKIVDWMDGKYKSSISQRVYSCLNREDLRPCAKDERTYFFKDKNITNHRYAVSINFRLPSTDKRFFFIDLLTGEVEKNYVTHGKGSGELMAEIFSNIPDSNMTSLGIYLVGEKYIGSHGETLRMYGLEATNDTAYERDIVLHGAKYADISFVNKINPKTGKPYARLGVSQGCPAITYPQMKKYLPFLENGGLIDHFF